MNSDHLVIEEVYENRRFQPLYKTWTKSKTVLCKVGTFTDQLGKTCIDKVDFYLPHNWHWLSNWQIDINENTDINGWLYYTSSDFFHQTALKEAIPSNKLTRTCYKRRRWIRKRGLIQTKYIQETQVIVKGLIKSGLLSIYNLW